MKFTGLAVSLALAGVVSSAALPTVPGISTSEGALAGAQGAADGLTAGIAGKRQLDAVQPITESAASSLNGVTGVTGSAVGTVESTVGGAAGTAENGVTGVLGASKRQLEGVTGTVTGLLNGVGGKRQLDAVQPVSESVASTLNGGTGIVGGAVGTAESTVGGVAGTAETAVSSGLGNVKRQFGNLPATFQQTGTDVLAGLSGNPSGIYGALNNLRTVVAAGEISPDQISNLPAAVQGVIAKLAVA
ncbi:uncharacterized protein N7469_004146 [Penicillium citrinum]|uniref:Uncharacterized protein n=2 Tax=Penicillium TaxID=5073 RepID=A0A9W9P3Y8_PENCI|nr:uncharacterized protein N7469_004146 [Penicillium citrinum]KAJ5234978.1 hypothetical protein N7469_004146 [Penicillium citrinum]KAJ5590596.1 hypothetical protein N7450_004568 [Penicillium hetheringtonii]